MAYTKISNANARVFHELRFWLRVFFVMIATLTLVLQLIICINRQTGAQ